MELAEIRQNIINWIAALRSGEYKQGRISLKTEDRYCCLGVAAEIGGYLNTSHEYEAYNQNLRVYGLADVHGVFYDSKGACGSIAHRRLTSLNDNMKFTFKQIADVIESNPDGLFRKDVAAYLKENPLS